MGKHQLDDTDQSARKKPREETLKRDDWLLQPGEGNTARGYHSLSRSSSFRKPGSSGSSTPKQEPAQRSLLSASVVPAEKQSNRQHADSLRAQLLGGLSASDDPIKKNVVEALPVVDNSGRLYNIAAGSSDRLPLTQRDRKYSNLAAQTNFESQNVQEMLRTEKFGSTVGGQRDPDSELARAILSDSGFQNDLEYVDDNAEKLARKKMRSDGLRRQLAINDYKRTQKVLETCPFCFGDDDSPPKVACIAMGTKCYLSCTPHQELVEMHCYIVPIQHHLSMLEGDDDLWEEVRNFMKCLLKMWSEEDKAGVFFETVVTIRKQQHTFIECVPMSWEVYDTLPAFFKESILAAGAEWTQHKKLIDFSGRPGGFRRCMVPNLPYFMIQFDYKGERGYGHVIETEPSVEEEPEDREGEQFPRWFASEIIGNILQMEPQTWRRPKRIAFHNNRSRIEKFREKYDKFDWTKMIHV